MVATVGKVLICYYEVFGFGLQAVATILGQQVHRIREFHKRVLTMLKFFTSLRSALGMSWSANQGQLVFLAKLELQMFVMIVERLVNYLESVLGVGLLRKQYIILLEMQYLRVEAVHLIFSWPFRCSVRGQTHSSLYFFENLGIMTFDSIIISTLLVYYLLTFILIELWFSYLQVFTFLDITILIVVRLCVDFLII